MTQRELIRKLMAKGVSAKLQSQACGAKFWTIKNISIDRAATPLSDDQFKRLRDLCELVSWSESK